MARHRNRFSPAIDQTRHACDVSRALCWTHHWPCRATATARRATGTIRPIARHVDLARGRGWVWPPARTKATSRARAPSTEEPKQAKGIGRSTRTGPPAKLRAHSRQGQRRERRPVRLRPSQATPEVPPQLSPQRTRARHFCPLVYSPFRVRECVGVSQRAGRHARRP